MYANVLLGLGLVEHVLSDTRTIGEALTRAKRETLEHRLSPLTVQADIVGLLDDKAEDLEPMRRDAVILYNLLGDPALVIRRPKADIALRFQDGRVEVEAPGRAQVELTLEYARTASVRPVPPLVADDPDPEARMRERYRFANDRVIRRWTVSLAGGRTSAELKLSDEIGTYVLKAWADGSAGAEAVAVLEK
jgi:hypothetical protein